MKRVSIFAAAVLAGVGVVYASAPEPFAAALAACCKLASLCCLGGACC